jgi:hypothetical protein
VRASLLSFSERAPGCELRGSVRLVGDDGCVWVLGAGSELCCVDGLSGFFDTLLVTTAKIKSHWAKAKQCCANVTLGSLGKKY